MQQYRRGMHLRLTEEYKQGLVGDSQITATHINELLNESKTPRSYELSELKQHDTILKEAVQNPGRWYDIPLVEKLIEPRLMEEQSLVEKLIAVASHYGNVYWLEPDATNPQGMYQSLYTAGPFAVMFTTNGGYSHSTAGMVHPLFAKIMILQLLKEHQVK